MSADRPRMLKLFKTWERVSQKGNDYQSGWWGDVEIVGFVKEIPHPKRPGETVREWTYFGQERDPERRPQARQASQEREPPARGQSSQNASRARPERPETTGRAILDARPRDRARGDWTTDPGQVDTPHGPDDEIPF